MGETLNLALSLAAGILLGLFFSAACGGQCAVVFYPGHPGTLVSFGSMLLRITVVMTGFYFLLGLPGESWKILLVGRLGLSLRDWLRRSFFRRFCTRFCLLSGTPGTTGGEIGTGEQPCILALTTSYSGSTAF